MLGQKGLTADSAGRERRKFPRLPVQIPVYFTSNSSHKHQSGLTRDISPHGLKIVARKGKMRMNDKVRFILPESRSVEQVQGISGRVVWTSAEKDRLMSGVSLESRIEDVLSYLLLMSSSQDALLSSSFFQSILDSLPDASILLDSQLKIIAISSNQPLLPGDPSSFRGEKISEAPTIIKQLGGKGFDAKKAISECLFSGKSRCFSALPLKLGSKEYAEERYFNLDVRPLAAGPDKELILVQIKDVTVLCKLKEKIRERNQALWSQYKFMTMGHIVDELLEDIISPLSALVGRLDLLTMKMTSAHEAGGAATDEWLRELHIMDGLVEQITEYCTVAAKRREREKLGSLEKTISFNKLIDETLLVLKPKSSFREVNIHLKFRKDLPEFEGDYFDWLNALIALFQAIIKEMRSQAKKEISVVTDVEGDAVLLSVSHNARALKIPLERKMELGILEVLRDKYGVSIKISGSNGCQTITFLVKKGKD